MIFLTNTDIEKQLDQTLLNEVLNDKFYLLNESEKYAVEVCRSYLQHRYNTALIFEPYQEKSELLEEDYFEGLKLYTASTSGNLPDKIEYVNSALELEKDNRDYILKDLVLSITMYDLLRKVSPSKMSDTIQDKYDFAIKQLEDFTRGRATLNVPLIDLSEDLTDNQTGFGFVWGTNKSSQTDY